MRNKIIGLIVLFFFVVTLTVAVILIYDLFKYDTALHFNILSRIFDTYSKNEIVDGINVNPNSISTLLPEGVTDLWKYCNDMYQQNQCPSNLCNPYISCAGGGGPNEGCAPGPIAGCLPKDCGDYRIAYERCPSDRCAVSHGSCVKIIDNLIERIAIITSISDPEEAQRVLNEAKTLQLQTLSFNSLTYLSQPIARVLAQYKGNLNFNKLQITEQLADSFISHEGILALGATPTSDAVVEKLAQHKGGLAFNDHPSSVLIAEILATHEGYLGIGGSFVPNHIIEALTQHRGDLNLSIAVFGYGAEAITQTKLLAKHIGNLYLTHLLRLSDEQADILAEHQGNIYFLNSLTEMSNNARDVLKDKAVFRTTVKFHFSD